MQGLNPTTRESIAVRDSAMSGDIAYRVSPAAVDRVAGATAWTQAIVIELVNSAGKVHDWFNGAIATAASVADTSTLGTATISGTTLTFVKGVATLTLSGSAHAWVADETATVTFPTKTICGKALVEKTHVTTIIAA